LKDGLTSAAEVEAAMRYYSETRGVAYAAWQAARQLAETRTLEAARDITTGLIEIFRSELNEQQRRRCESRVRRVLDKAVR
jgi:hypothetical protein